jgi:hypothetical protein
LSAAEQGIAAARRRASLSGNAGTVCNAIMAIFAALKPAAPHDDGGP